MGVKTGVARDYPVNLSGIQAVAQLSAVPVHREIAVVDYDRPIGIDQFSHREDRSTRPKLRAICAHHACFGSACQKVALQVEPRVIEMDWIADEDNVVPVREHVDDVIDDELPVNLEQKLWPVIAERGESRANPRHGNDQKRPHRFIA